MYKSYLGTVSTCFCSLLYKTNTFFFQLVQTLLYTSNAKSNMMNAFTFFFYK